MAHKLPTIGSFDGTKTIVTQTANLGSFDGTFQQADTFGQQTANLYSFDGQKWKWRSDFNNGLKAVKFLSVFLLFLIQGIINGV